MILKAHTLESLKTSDARDMGVGLEDMTSARITDSVGNVLPENTDGHIQLLIRALVMSSSPTPISLASLVFKLSSV